MLAEKQIRLKPVIELIVVSSGIPILMPFKSLFFPIQSVNRLQGVQRQRLNQRGSGTTIVLGVIVQEHRSRRHESLQVGVILAVEEVGASLFHVAEITKPASFDALDQRREPGYRRYRRDSFVERTQS